MTDELPEGISAVHSFWGDPKTDTEMAASHGGVRLITDDDSVPYFDQPVSREKKCRANDDTCNGWRIRDSDFCAAHAGVFTRRPVTDEPADAPQSHDSGVTDEPE